MDSAVDSAFGRSGLLQAAKHQARTTELLCRSGRGNERGNLDDQRAGRDTSAAGRRHDGLGRDGDCGRQHHRLQLASGDHHDSGRAEAILLFSRGSARVAACPAANDDGRAGEQLVNDNRNLDCGTSHDDNDEHGHVRLDACAKEQTIDRRDTAQLAATKPKPRPHRRSAAYQTRLDRCKSASARGGNPLPNPLPPGEGLEFGRYTYVFGTLDVRRGEPSPSGPPSGRGQGEGSNVDSSSAVIGLGGSTPSSVRFSS
jgi:hypothetical protein